DALVRINFAFAIGSAAAPAVPVALVPVVPVVPVAPAAPLVVVSVESDGACFRQPVTVMRRAELDAVVCGAEVVCPIAAVANATSAVQTPVQIVFVMQPPANCLQRSDRHVSSAFRERQTACRKRPSENA